MLMHSQCCMTTLAALACRGSVVVAHVAHLDRICCRYVRQPESCVPESTSSNLHFFQVSGLWWVPGAGIARRECLARCAHRKAGASHQSGLRPLVGAGVGGAQGASRSGKTTSPSPGLPLTPNVALHVSASPHVSCKPMNTVRHVNTPSNVLPAAHRIILAGSVLLATIVSVLNYTR